MAWPALGRPRYPLQSCSASGRLRADRRCVHASPVPGLLAALGVYSSAFAASAGIVELV